MNSLYIAALTLPLFPTYGTGQLQAVVVQRLSSENPSQRAVITMVSIDLVVGNDHLLGSSCQRYDWQTGR